jgi:NAD(P)-dependent dehydrogenase (short-subunit alcohol dehydrogenase family)
MGRRKTMQDFTGRTAIVTGGGSGIGHATALAFAREGANVVIVDFSEERAREAAATITALGRKAVAVTCDVGDDNALINVRNAALDQFGRIDILMNNVGLCVTGNLLDIGIDHWRKTLEINFLATVRAVQLMLPDIMRQGEGHIVNVASTAALYPYNTDRMPYNASKAAVVSFSEALAMELQPSNVGVTLLCPGPTRTNMVERIVSVTPNLPMLAPELPVMQSEELGRMVVEAIRSGTFFLPAHAEVHAIYAEHGESPDRFLAKATARYYERKANSEGVVVG